MSGVASPFRQAGAERVDPLLVALWIALIIVAVVGLLGWLFFKLIRALARIQMPDRPGR